MLRYTLLTDGSSDRALTHVVNWLLDSLMDESGSREAFVSEWADFRGRRRPPRSLRERIACAVKDYPCDLLFIHRDSEREPLDARSEEIVRALSEMDLRGTAPVHLIPVRMIEAWLLIDEDAIRKAAANPGSRVELELPRLQRIEDLVDPKQTLHEALRRAFEYTGRRLRKFNVDAATHRVAESIQDFSPLRELPAFRQFETLTRVAFAAWRNGR